MKVLKNIFIGIGFVLILIIAPTLVLPFGACAIIGFIIVGILDAVGILSTKNWGSNATIIVSAVLGALILLLYYLITGHSPL